MPDLVDGDLNVGEGITLDGHEVGIPPRSCATKIGGPSEQVRAVNGSGFERLFRSHPGFYEPGQLAGVLAEHAEDGVRPHRERHAGLPRALRGLEVAGDVAIESFDR